MDWSGRQIKGYELLEPLGQGAFGAVYRGFQSQINRDVAVKIILPEHANRPEFIQRFESEAHLIAQLEHLHIVPLYDYWREQDGAYLVMRLMHGSLKDLLETRRLTLEEVSRIIEQIGSALALAHRRGVIHRDLKPANILLDEDGNAYLSDFGIAKGIQMNQGLTGTGAILGSPGYMAPEQIKSESITSQTDIYALGVVLYELLTGNHPFPDTPVGVLMLKQVSDPLPRLTDAHSDLPQGLDDVIQRATAKVSAHRYADVTAFLTDFRLALNLKAAHESEFSFGDWVRRRRLALEMSQVELAQIVGCAPATIQKIETGERRPSRLLVQQLTDHLLFDQDALGEGANFGTGPETSEFLERSMDFSYLQHTDENPAYSDGFMSKTPESRPPVFVARKKELESLKKPLKTILNYQGQVVFIVGEAGYGKTTLFNEFTRRVMEDHPDLIIARGSCNAFSGIGDPYLPFRDVLGMLRGDIRTQWSAGILSRRQAENLASFSTQVHKVLSQEGPDLMNVIAPGKSAAASAGERERLFIFEQFTQVFHTLSLKKPMVVLLDDLQWADSASLSLLFHIGMRLAGARILLIGSYRPSDIYVNKRQGMGGFQHPLHEMVTEFRRRYGNIEIDLGDYPEEEGRLFINDYLDSEPNKLGRDFREALFQRTRGHPLFTVELLRAMQERGDIYQDDNRSWAASPALVWESLPARVEAAIEQRLGRLEADLHEILSIASIEGEFFTAQVIALVSGTNERTLLHRLSAELVSRHKLVLEQGEVETKEGILARYKFGHVIFQEYLINRLSRAERRMLHRAVAEAIGILYGEERQEVAPQLARHYRLAGDRDLALKYSLKSALLAEGMHALDEAVRHLHHALDMLSPGEFHRERFEILERLGDDYALLGDRPRALSLYERALDLWYIRSDGIKPDAVRLHRKIGEMVVYMTWFEDRRRFESTGHNHLVAGQRLIENDPSHQETARLLTTLANEAWLIHEPANWDLAEEFALRAVAMAEELESDTELSAALDALGNVYGGRGMFRERLDVSLRRLALSRSPDFRDLRQKANILQQTGFAYQQVGEYRDALPYLFEAEEISSEIQALDQLFRALRHQATCWFRLDEWGKVLEIEQKRLALVEKYPNFDERVGPT